MGSVFGLPVVAVLSDIASLHFMNIVVVSREAPCRIINNTSPSGRYDPFVCSLVHMLCIFY